MLLESIPTCGLRQTRKHTIRHQMRMNRNSLYQVNSGSCGNVILHMCHEVFHGNHNIKFYLKEVRNIPSNKILHTAQLSHYWINLYLTQLCRSVNYHWLVHHVAKATTVLNAVIKYPFFGAHSHEKVGWWNPTCKFTVFQLVLSLEYTCQLIVHYVLCYYANGYFI